jgi:hypothetical protein
MEELHQRINTPSCSYSAPINPLKQKTMIGGTGACPLSDSFDPEDEEFSGGRIKAPNVNAASSKQHKSLKRILIDSRNRDTSLYPNANNFVQTLPVPIRAVRSITLTDARIPVVDITAYLYGIICCPDLSGGVLINSRESSQYAPGALAIVPMIPSYVGAPHTYYQAFPGQKFGGSGGVWRLDFPMGVTLSQIRVQVHVFDTAGASILLPIVDPVPTNLSFNTNLYIALEIEHDV